MPIELEMDGGRFHEMAAQAVDIVEQYYAQLSNMPVMPRTTSDDVRRLIREPLPDKGAEFLEALATIRDVVYPLSRHNAHSRFFGYVASPGTPAAAVAELLAGGLNANVTSWRSAPAAAEMEHLVIDWLKTMIGYPSESAGLLISGGSMANFSALAAARAAKAPGMGRDGQGGAALRIYISDQGHVSIPKAASLLGIGSKNVQFIPTDASFRIDLEQLRRRLDSDVKGGHIPMCIVGNAGTVNTGAVDPLADLADIAARYQTWLHVDGAYGALAASAPTARRLFAGIDRVDSVSLDPHKWLYTSVGCGCVLYRDAGRASAAFAHEAEYTRPLGLSRDEAFAFWDLGPELSRPFRALQVWLQIKTYGARRLSLAIDNNIACARHFGALVEDADDFELLAPVELSIFCFRYRPPGFTGDLNALNERILVALQAGGSSYVSNARIRDAFALRGCVLNYRTKTADMERLLEDVRAAGRTAASEL